MSAIVWLEITGSGGNTQLTIKMRMRNTHSDKLPESLWPSFPKRIYLRSLLLGAEVRRANWHLTSTDKWSELERLLRMGQKRLPHYRQPRAASTQWRRQQCVLQEQASQIPHKGMVVQRGPRVRGWGQYGLAVCTLKHEFEKTAQFPALRW